MRCVECESIEEFIFDHTAVWIHPATSEAARRLSTALTDAGIEARPEGSRCLSLQVDRPRFAQVIDVLHASLHGPELVGSKMVTTAGPDPSVEDLGRVLPIGVFINRFRGQWLIDLLEAERYETWFQPIVRATDLDPTTPYAREGLFRMRDDEGKLVPPSEVFGVAGDADLLFSVDLIARRSAVEHAARARVDSKIFINFNPSAIYDPAYCLRTTAATIEEHGLDPSSIVFEMVETHRARDDAHLNAILEFYREAGFGVALDDIGSGWSGLSMLNRLRPDYVKIDMDLIRDVDRSPGQQTILQSLIAIASTLGITTVAEGIEREGEAAWLVDAGIDLLQGYYFGRPAPLSPPTPRGLGSAVGTLA